ncbi:MAG: hypothetical protein ACI8RN_001471 [Glaciecola sp.]|jgi:hypothetical protein|uniref:hypothetical protein n=1 Tax=Congregibacter sp. TaxID=2744308 RepID=UPI0039E58DC4
MQKVTKRFAAVVAMSLLVSQGSWANGDTTDESRLAAAQSALISSAFHSPPSTELQMLDEQAMSSTQGELWPWIIGVVALDLSLASFFWGNYVPIMTASSGFCVNCDIGSKSR